MYRIIAVLVTACALATAWGQPLYAQVSPASGAAPASAVERTRAILEAYWQDHDPRYVAEDAVFTMMPTGEEIRGREAIAQHLQHFYHEAFDARAERIDAIFGENKGLLEATVVGTHTGEFAGIPASGRAIRVPLSVAYELEGDQIKTARIYLMANVLFEQIRPDRE